jgi:hypothetical protein
LTDWNTKPTLSWRNFVSSFASWSEMSSPPTTIVPSVADRIPPAIEHSVVLPEPDGPTSATISSLPSVSVA